MTRMTGPDCVIMCNLINTYIHTYSSKICTSRESVSPLSCLIRGFRNKCCSVDLKPGLVGPEL